MSEKILAKLKEFPSLHYMMRNAAYNLNKPTDTYLMVKTKDRYEDITYEQVFKQLNALSAYLYSKGFRKGDKAALLIENCPEYICFDQALMQLGVVNISIYPSSGESDIEYILNDSGAKAILVGTPFLLRKLNKVKANCPKLEFAIAAYDAKTSDTLTYKQIVEEGSVLYPQLKENIEGELKSVGFEDLACLLYTSGTTGRPKGAMLTHLNFMSNLVMAVDLLPIVSKEFIFLSFLPLCHVYERTCTYYLGTYVGFKVAFAQSLEALSSNIQEVRPTAILTVPRLLERIEEKVRKNATTSGKIKAAIFNWALKTGETRRLLKEAGKPIGWWLGLKYNIADKLVYMKIKEKLGGRMTIMVSGGGALPKHVGEFFANLDILVLEGYGLTETSPFVCANEVTRQVWGTVGRIGEGNVVAIQNPDTHEIYTVQSYDTYRPDFESPEGEILVKGMNVMKGYWNLPEETAKAIDKDGWLHTGDVGKFHKGYLKITDRIKNILVNSFGKNIYPTPIENVYMQSPRIEQIFLIGDRQEYITAIIVPSREEIKEKWGHGDDYFEQPDDFIREKDVWNWVEEDLRKLEGSLGKFERIKNFSVKRRPFSLDNGEMTPTQKIKRKVVETLYAEEIKAIYTNVS